MLAQSYKQQYQKVKVETAGPGELLIILYEELNNSLLRSKVLFEQNNTETMMVSLHHARAIIYEFINSLDMKYEISNQLRALYEFYLSQLSEFIIKKDISLLDSTIEFFKDMLLTWKEAVLIAKSGKNK